MKKRYYLIWSALAIVCILLVPVIINESYKNNIGYKTLWSAADMLSYYGAVLSFIGTVILGVVAVWQNNKAIITNDKLLELEKKSNYGYLIPKHKFHHEIMDMPYVYHHDFGKRGITLVGTGNDIINIIKIIAVINGSRTIENDFRLFVTTTDDFREVYVPIELDENEENCEELNISLKVFMENSRKYQYIQTLELLFKKESEHRYSLIGFNSLIEDR